MVTLLPWDSANILESPFVAVLSHIGVPAAAQIMNFIVLTAVLSCLNSGLYTTSRMLYSLAERNEAPQRFMKLSKRGVPVQAIIAKHLFLLYCRCYELLFSRLRIFVPGQFIRGDRTARLSRHRRLTSENEKENRTDKP
ncbi:amino acid permease [Bacillus velezensis]